MNVKCGTVLLQYLYVIYPDPAMLRDLIRLQSRTIELAPHVDQKVEFSLLDNPRTHGGRPIEHGHDIKDSRQCPPCLLLNLPREGLIECLPRLDVSTDEVPATGKQLASGRPLLHEHTAGGIQDEGPHDALAAVSLCLGLQIREEAGIRPQIRRMRRRVKRHRHGL